MPALWLFESAAGEFRIRYRNGYWQALHGTTVLCKRTSPQQALENLICCHAPRFAGVKLPQSLYDWAFTVDGCGNEEQTNDAAVSLCATLMASISGKAKVDS